MGWLCGWWVVCWVLRVFAVDQHMLHALQGWLMLRWWCGYVVSKAGWVCGKCWIRWRRRGGYQDEQINGGCCELLCSCASEYKKLSSVCHLTLPSQRLTNNDEHTCSTKGEVKKKRRNAIVWK